MRHLRETLNKSFDKLRTNGKLLIPRVVSPATALRTCLSNALLCEAEGHERNQLVQRFLGYLVPLAVVAILAACGEEIH